MTTALTCADPKRRCRSFSGTILTPKPRCPISSISPVPSESLEDAKISLDGFESGKEYKVVVETVGYKLGDVYSVYLEKGFTELPTREETIELSKKAEPEKTAFTVLYDENGHLEFTLPQSENQVDFVRISL